MAKKKENKLDDLDVFKDAKEIAGMIDAESIVKQAMGMQVTEHKEGTTEIITPTRKELVEKLEATVKMNQWDTVKEAMEGELAEKALNIMRTLPDREFLRHYFKFIEFFKPKVTRVAPIMVEQEDNRVTINIMSINEKGENEIIDITEHNDDEEV